MTRVEATAEVAPDARIGEGSCIWHLAQIREGAVLGKNCIIGRGAYVGPGVFLGDNCKVQNYALLYEPASLHDGVFVGPAVILTNDQYPRAINSDGRQKSGDDWHHVGVTVRRGASIGARAVCVAPLTIGAWALVAAGSVVIKDVPDFALVAGVPAVQIRWVGTAGTPLEKAGDGIWRCPTTGAEYSEENGILTQSSGPERGHSPGTGQS